MNLHKVMLLGSTAIWFGASCAWRDSVIPESLAAQVDRSLTFTELKDSPMTHVGKVIVLGGEVLQGKRSAQGTLIEVFQLPLDHQEPVSDARQSQGRFLTLYKEFLDPATLSDRPHVTIVGEVTGARTQRLDDVEYTYPLLA